MRRALWRGVELAAADRTLCLGGCEYFPPEAVRWEHLLDSPRRAWRWPAGRVAYLSVSVDDEVVTDIAWYLQRPLPAAYRVHRHVAFAAPVRLAGGQ